MLINGKAKWLMFFALIAVGVALAISIRSCERSAEHAQEEKELMQKQQKFDSLAIVLMEHTKADSVLAVERRNAAGESARIAAEVSKLRRAYIGAKAVPITDPDSAYLYLVAISRGEE